MHNHEHYHGHSGNDHQGSANIKSAFFLNLTFTIIEIIGGLYTNSVAILSDALHDLGDSLSLGLSWYLEKFSKKKRDVKYTYGYGRFSLLAAFINGLVLITGSILILTEAIPRLANPESPDAKGMIFLAVLGIAFNGAAAFKLKGGHSLNEKVVSWHLLEDVFGWVAVLIAAIAMLLWDIPILDPILSIGFTLFILYNVIKNFKETVKIFLQAKPSDIDINKLSGEINLINEVESSHDIHIWSMDGSYYVMTVHIVVSDQVSTQQIIRIKNQVRKTSNKYGIEHSTVEIEFEDEQCELEDC